MRIIFSGVIGHAIQLLGDLERRSGVNGDYRKITAALVELLPEVTHASFSGDVDLPTAQWNQFGYLAPTMYITTSHAASSIDIKQATPEMDLITILETVIDSKEANFQKEGQVLRWDTARLKPTCQFKPQPNFRYNSLKFFDRTGFSYGRDSTEVEIEVKYPVERAGITVMTLRVTEQAVRGSAYKFAKRVAQIVPNVCVLYYSRDEKEGWEIIRQGWDWNKGNPRILMEEDYQRMAEIEHKLEPYKEFIMPYLRAKGLSKACFGAGHIFSHLESLYLQGVTNPVLATNLAIILGGASGTVLAATMFPVEVDLDKRIPADAAKTASEIAACRIGIKVRFWRSFRGLPSSSKVAETVLSMFEVWQQGPKLKEMNDEFTRQYPATA